MSDELAQREMTLAEWVGKLYEGHTARVELAALERELAEARKEVGKWRTDFDYARADAEAAFRAGAFAGAEMVEDDGEFPFGALAAAWSRYQHERQA